MRRIDDVPREESTEIVWALLELAARGDALASRTVLQVLVPGLAGELRWLKSWARLVRPQMLDDGEIDQLVVAAGIAAIDHAAGTRKPWPVLSMLRRAHRTLKFETQSIEAWQTSTEVLDDSRLLSIGESESVSPSAVLLDALVRARDVGAVSSAEVRLLWLIDVEGYTSAELAPDLGISPRSVAQRRLRAERRLVDLLAS
ncbi:MAG: hypothetical protein R2770_00790 [Acidimicrobiales bacterium]